MSEEYDRACARLVDELVTQSNKPKWLEPINIHLSNSDGAVVTRGSHPDERMSLTIADMKSQHGKPEGWQHLKFKKQGF